MGFRVKNAGQSTEAYALLAAIDPSFAVASPNRRLRTGAISQFFLTKSTQSLLSGLEGTVHAPALALMALEMRV